MSTRDLATPTAAFETPFGELGRSPQNDRDCVVIAWPSVPVEVIRAAGFVPVFVRSAARPTPMADVVLEPGVFPGRIHQLFEAALTGRLADVAAIVLPRTSDPDYKAYLHLKELERQGTRLPPVLLFELLQSGRDTLEYDAARVRELSEELATLAGRRLAVETLHTQILRTNAARDAARRIVALRAGEPRIAGTEAMALLGAFWQLQPEHFCAMAERTTDVLAARPSRTGPRIMLAGAPVDSPALHAAIESLHATVVDETGPYGNDVCTGRIDPAVEPCEAIASWYAPNAATPRLSGAALSRRMATALTGVDAAVVLLPPSDARFGWEVPRLRSFFDEYGIPHLSLELEPGEPPGPATQRLLCDLLCGIARAPAVSNG